MLRTGVAIGVLGTILFTVLLGGYRLHATNRDRAVEQFQELELNTAEKLAALLQSELTGVSRTLRTVAHSVSSDPHSIDYVLHQQDRCSENICFTALALFGTDGVQHAAGGKRIELTNSELTESFAWLTNAVRDSVRVSITSPRPPSLVLFTPMPVPRSGESAHGGMLAVQMSLDALFRNHQRSPGAGWPNYETLVFRRDGTVVFHSEHPEMQLNNVYRRSDRCLACHQSFDHVERMLALQHGVFTYTVRNKEYLAAVAPVAFEAEQWIVAVKVPRNDAVGLLSAQVQQLGGLSLIVVILVATAATITWRDGQRRIKAEAEAVQKANLENSHIELTALNAQLEHAAREWRTTVDMIDAALIVLEPSGSILRMNLAAAATLPDGLTAWLGRPSRHLLERQPWAAALALADTSLQVEGQPSATARVRDSVAGRTWDIGYRVLPDRQYRTALILARDVTDVVELQESVQRSETMAALGTLVVGVAHEVRNPLFAISSLVDAWAIQPHRDPTPFVDALRGEVNRLRTLMVELLEYGRPAKFTRQLQSLREVIDGAVRSCAHEASVRRVSVSFSAANDVDVFMDSRRLERVFINLVQNAIQHSPEDSAVEVEMMVVGPGVSRTPPTAVEVTVRDRGAGFAPEDLPRAFKPFFSRRPGGFGLGLAITERIVTEHQGRVSAANDPRGGAVITVSLPLTHARSAGAGRELTSSC